MKRFLIILFATTAIASAQNEAVTINTKTKKVVNPLVNFGTGNTVDFTGATVEGLTPGLTFADSLVNTANTVTLVNDAAIPGNSKYYGTDSGGTLGYHTLSAGGVTSFNTRSGAVTSQTGDYTAAQVTGAVPDTRTVNGHALSGNVTVSASDVGAPSGSGTSSGTNTGDQTSIVGISGTLSEFNTALTGADFATGGGVITGTSSGTNTGDQTADGILGLSGNGFVKRTGTNTYTNDSSTYITGNQTITLSGDVTGSGSTAITTTLANIPAVAGTNLTGTAANLTAGHVTTNADLTGNVTSVGNATTLAVIPAISGANLTGTAASLTAGNATKWTTGRTIALTGDVTYTSGSLDGSGNVTGTATLANIPAIAGTNLTGTASGLTAGTVTTNANLTGPITSSGNATSIASQTGTGTKFVVDTSPTLVTPVLGVATATSINGNAFTTGTYALTGVAGKTLTFNKSLTLDGTDSTTMTFPATSATLARTDAANTFTGASTATSWTFTTPVLGTPSSGTLTNCTGTANGLTAGDVTRNHAVYAGASPPTVDVGIFTVVITGIDLKTAATTTVFTVPSGRAFTCISAHAVVTAVSSAGSGTQTFTIKESGGSKSMTGATASAAVTPAPGSYYVETPTAGSGPFTICAAGNIVQFVNSTSHAGSTTVTGSVFVTGFYTQ